MTESTSFRLVKIETEVRIRTTVEAAFRAFTDGYDDWWPHRYKPDSRCSVDAKPGGYIYEHFANGGGAVTGTIVYLDPPFAMASSSPSSLSRGSTAYGSMKFEADGDEVVLKRSMQLWGAIDDDLEKMFVEGTRQMMEVALKGYLEEGRRYEVAR